MAILDQKDITRLLGSIEAGNLVILCGAGLSIPQPSNLLSAVGVSRICFDKWKANEDLPAELRDDIDGLAAHFYGQGNFKSVFIAALVPWNRLVGEPNNGHAAVGDFLICRAVHGALSANFDTLIEQWSQRHKIAMRGALDGAEAVKFSANANPLLKFHGCFHREPENTIWTQGQLSSADLKDRIDSCSKWINLNLPGKDILIVGFWTDWGYLNGVIADALQVKNANSVTVVDPATSEELEHKAPVLWDKLRTASASFVHIKTSGSDALEELRTEFSRSWAKKFFNLGEPFIRATGQEFSLEECSPETWSCDDLYDLRRDAEGRPYTDAACDKQPPPQSASGAFLHILLSKAGAERKGSHYELNGERIRIVNGAGQLLESLKERFKEPPSVAAASLVICAGAQSVGIPGSIICSGAGGSVVRPAPGGTARWLSTEDARSELEI
ncbi:MAG: SIR2 family protein [Xanthobacteraceae bacterium]|nr:SIR2 family protein [Xanthobacteraceae bacterium]